MSRVKLGDLLLQKKLITPEQKREALNEQHNRGGKLGSILIDKRFLTQEQLYDALSEHFHIERVYLTEIDIALRTTELIDEATCRQYNLIPLVELPQKNTLIIAVSDPTDIVMIDELSFKLGMRIEMRLASEKDITSAIDYFYGKRSAQQIDINSVRVPAEILFGPLAPMAMKFQQLTTRVNNLEKSQTTLKRAIASIAQLCIDAGVFSKESYAEQMKFKN